MPSDTAVMDDNNEILRYSSAAVQHSLQRGEAPNAPLLTMGAAVGFGCLTDEAKQQANSVVDAWAPVCDIVAVYCDLVDDKASFDVTAMSFYRTAKCVECRTIVETENEPVEEEEKSTQTADTSVTETTTTTSTAMEVQKQKSDPQPDKTRINRYTRDENNKPVQEFPPGVAGVTKDGRKIPIVNDGKDFDPKLPNVLGDMEYRNRLLSTEYVACLFLLHDDD